MYKEYKANRVKNHSVGMQYVNIELALNDEEEKDEFATWNKYIDSIANREEVEQKGYFWAVKEAKVIEGSAVPIGSNRITPTLDNTEKQPPLSTADQLFDIAKAISNIKNIL